MREKKSHPWSDAQYGREAATHHHHCRRQLQSRHLNGFTCNMTTDYLER